MQNRLDQTNNPIGCTDVVKLSYKDYGSCKITFDNNGKATVTLIGKGKFENYKCVNDTCTKGEEKEIYKETLLNGAYPRLDEGMIPVTIANDGTVTSADVTSEWYSYAADNKRWANVVLIKEVGTKTREYYKTHQEAIPETSIYAYLVWIPRYKYKLFNVGGSAAAYDVNGLCTSNCPPKSTDNYINITFEGADTRKSTGTTNNTYLTHPAFTYGSRELNGIWVGKFETTGTALEPKIKPNVAPLIWQNISTQFATSIKFGIDSKYGIISESRMSKNSDWGGVVYLSYSNYGIHDEIRVNNYRNNYQQLTGCGANTANAERSTTCGIVYGDINQNGVFPQSTTGNIYGIFDISGGSWESQMGVLEDSNHFAMSGICNLYNSGYTGLYGNPGYVGCDANIGSNTTGINLPSKRYYKLYNETNKWVNLNYLGEAIGETKGWFRDHTSFINQNFPWFIRGGDYSSDISAGGFGMYNSGGNVGDNISFRTIVISE